MADADGTDTVSGKSYSIYSDYGASGKLLLQVRRPYAGPWAKAEEAAADPGADASLGMDQLDADADAADAADAAGAATPSDPIAATDDLATPTDGAQDTTPTTPNLLEALDAEIAKLEGPPQGDALPDLKVPEGLSEDAQTRFQKLANQVREGAGTNQQLAQQLQDQQRYSQQVQQWAQSQVQQAQQQAQQMQQQIQQLQQQMQTATTQQADPNDPVAPFRRDLINEIKGQRDEEIGALRQEIANMQEAHAQQQRQGHLRQQSAEYRGEALQVAREITLAGLPDELVSSLANSEAPLILARAMTTNTSLEAAAQLQRLHTLKVARAFAGANSTALRETLKKSNGAPPVTTGPSNVKGTGVKIPTKQELANKGHYGPNALFDWSLAEGVTLPG
jgi:hypothetical protein